MYLSIHATAGVLIGTVVTQSPLAFIIGFFSHFFLDMLPHSDGDIPPHCNSVKQMRKRYLGKIISIIYLDICLTIVIATLLFTNNLQFVTPAIVWGVIGSILPDVIQIIAFFLPKVKILQRYQEFHNLLHYNPKHQISIVAGHLTQLATLIILISPIL